MRHARDGAFKSRALRPQRTANDRRSQTSANIRADRQRARQIEDLGTGKPPQSIGRPVVAKLGEERRPHQLGKQRPASHWSKARLRSAYDCAVACCDRAKRRLVAVHYGGNAHGIIIALAAQQLGQQLRIRARSTIDLRGVGGLVALLLQRRLLAESFEEAFRIAGCFEPRDDDAVSLFAGRGVRGHIRSCGRSFNRSCGRRVRRRWSLRLFRIEVRPIDTDVRHGVERSRRIQLSGVGGLRYDLWCREAADRHRAH